MQSDAGAEGDEGDVAPVPRAVRAFDGGEGRRRSRRDNLPRRNLRVSVSPGRPGRQVCRVGSCRGATRTTRCWNSFCSGAWAARRGIRTSRTGREAPRRSCLRDSRRTPQTASEHVPASERCAQRSLGSTARRRSALWTHRASNHDSGQRCRTWRNTILT